MRRAIALGLAAIAVATLACASPGGARAQAPEDEGAASPLDPEIDLPLTATDPFGDGSAGPLTRGWSNEAAYVGFLSALLDLALGVTAVAAAAPGDDLGLAFGTAMVGAVGLGGPIAAIGAASARTHPFVPGSIELQIAAWITWGLSLAGGAALLALDVDENAPARWAFLAPTVVGAASLVLFSFDALVSNIQVGLVSGSR